MSNQDCGKSINTLDNRPKKRRDPISEDVRAMFRIGVRLFGREGVTLYQIYRRTLAKFFSVGYRQVGEIRLPILPPEEDLPSWHQFRYWYRKEWRERHRAVQGRCRKREPDVWSG